MTVVVEPGERRYDLDASGAFLRKVDGHSKVPSGHGEWGLLGLRTSGVPTPARPRRGPEEEGLLTGYRVELKSEVKLVLGYFPFVTLTSVCGVLHV